MQFMKKKNMEKEGEIESLILKVKEKKIKWN